MATKQIPLLTLEEYRILLRADLTSFTEACFAELNPGTKFVFGPHLELLASKLEACRDGKIKRLIITLPPRNLKSLLVSVAFPAFLLGHNPTARILCTSYSQDLVDKMARDCRKVMESAFYNCCFPGTRIGERNAIHDFETTQQGGRLAISGGGSMTGRGADFIVIDDPIKPEDALSDSIRKSVNDWIASTLLSRLNDKATGCIILVMQRLHQDDLVGDLLDQGGWELVSLPAIAANDETHVIKTVLGTRVWHRPAGEALHPQREPLSVLAEARVNAGAYNFQSQYLQDPIPIAGNLVKRDWFKSYEPGSEPARFDYIVQSWDTANKAGELNDYSVCTIWGIKGNNYYLLHVFRRRLNFPDLKRAVIELKQRFRPQRILIEDKASGTQLIQELRHLGITVTPCLPPSGMDKLMRLHAHTAPIEAGQIFLPTRAEWLEAFVSELTSFPGGKNDDQVDSTTQFLAHMGGRRRIVVSDEFLEIARKRLSRLPPF